MLLDSCYSDYSGYSYYSDYSYYSCLLTLLCFWPCWRETLLAMLATLQEDWHQQSVAGAWLENKFTPLAWKRKLAPLVVVAGHHMVKDAGPWTLGPAFELGPPHLGSGIANLEQLP